MARARVAEYAYREPALSSSSLRQATQASSGAPLVESRTYEQGEPSFELEQSFGKYCLPSFRSSTANNVYQTVHNPEKAAVHGLMHPGDNGMWRFAIREDREAEGLGARR